MLIPAAALALAPAAFAGVLTDATVATYDPLVPQANQVDFTATPTGSGDRVIGTGGTAATDTEYQAFTAAVAAAFLTDTGGVIDFDGGVFSGPDENATRAGNQFSTLVGTYGVSGTNSLTITSSDALELGTDTANRTPISGTTYLSKATAENNFVFTFGTGLQQVGLTFLSRTGTNLGTVTATATFSDLSTASSSRVVGTTAAGAGDTFFGFIAPTGTTLTGVTLDPAGFSSLDDIGFVVPEPASLALLGLGGLMLRPRPRRQP